MTCQDMVVSDGDTRTLTGVYLTITLLLEHSGLNYSCFLYKDPYYIFLIETKTKFSNLIGYHQPANLRTNRAVYASCL